MKFEWSGLLWAGQGKKPLSGSSTTAKLNQNPPRWAVLNSLLQMSEGRDVIARLRATQCQTVCMCVHNSVRRCVHVLCHASRLVAGNISSDQSCSSALQACLCCTICHKTIAAMKLLHGLLQGSCTARVLQTLDSTLCCLHMQRFSHLLA